MASLKILVKGAIQSYDEFVKTELQPEGTSSVQIQETINSMYAALEAATSDRDVYEYDFRRAIMAVETCLQKIHQYVPGEQKFRTLRDYLKTTLVIDAVKKAKENNGEKFDYVKIQAEVTDIMNIMDVALIKSTNIIEDVAERDILVASNKLEKILREATESNRENADMTLEEMVYAALKDVLPSKLEEDEKIATQAMETAVDPVLLKARKIREMQYLFQWKDYLADYDAIMQRYIHTCQYIGYKIAQSGDHIMVGVKDWKTLRGLRSVATYVVEGASAVKPVGESEYHDIEFYIPQDPEPVDATINVRDTLRELSALNYINIKERLYSRATRRSAAMITDVKKSDAVILIGGGDGAASIGYAGIAFDKIVVPITGFSGAAAELYEAVLGEEYAKNHEIYGITTKQFLSLQFNWQNTVPPESAPDHHLVDNAPAMVDDDLRNAAQVDMEFNSSSIISILTKRYEYVQAMESERRGLPRRYAVNVIASALAWVLFYAAAPIFDVDSNFVSILLLYALLFIASIFGTFLRNAVNFRNAGYVSSGRTVLILDVAIGVGISVVMAALFFVGSITFTGEIVTLSEPLNAADGTSRFQSIGLTLSLLGLASGYLLPTAVLEERLGEIIEGQNNNA